MTQRAETGAARRIAVVTQESTGGVRSTVDWLTSGLRANGMEVDIHILATRIRDEHSRRFLAPATWSKPVGVAVPEGEVFRWGTQWVELESNRYRPRSPLTRILETYDIVQVVAGTPAPALAAGKVGNPAFLLAATVQSRERPSRLSGMPPPQRVWKTATLPWVNRLESRAVLAVDHVFAMNRRLMAWVREHGQTSVSMAPTGVDTKRFHPAESWNPYGPIVCLGRLNDSRKNWPLALAAFASLKKRYGVPNHLWIAGSSPVADNLTGLARDLGVESSVRVHTDFPGTQLPGFLTGGSLFLQTSKDEGLGIAGLEAMASGLPMVSTRTVGGDEYLEDGINGRSLEFGPRLADRLADAMAEVLNGSGASMAAQARATVVERFADEMCLARILSVYDTYCPHR